MYAAPSFLEDNIEIQKLNDIINVGREAISNIGSSGTDLIKKMRLLFSQKKEFESTREMLLQLEKTKSEISNETYQDLKLKYIDKIKSLNDTIIIVIDAGNKRKEEILVSIKSLNENINKCESYLNEAKLLAVKSAMTQEELKQKQYYYSNQIKDIKSNIKKLEAEKAEIDYYLNQKEEITYQKQNTIKKLSEVKSKLPYYFTSKLFRITISVVGVLLIIFAGFLIYKKIFRNYGAINPVSAIASSECKSVAERFTFNAYNAIDGDKRTVWSPSQKYGVGLNQWIKFSFDSPKKIRKIEMINGFPMIDYEYGDLLLSK